MFLDRNKPPTKAIPVALAMMFPIVFLPFESSWLSPRGPAGWLAAWHLGSLVAAATSASKLPNERLLRPTLAAWADLCDNKNDRYRVDIVCLERGEVTWLLFAFPSFLPKVQPQASRRRMRCFAMDVEDPRRAKAVLLVLI